MNGRLQFIQAIQIRLMFVHLVSSCHETRVRHFGVLTVAPAVTDWLKDSLCSVRASPERPVGVEVGTETSTDIPWLAFAFTTWHVCCHSVRLPINGVGIGFVVTVRLKNGNDGHFSDAVKSKFRAVEPSYWRTLRGHRHRRSCLGHPSIRMSIRS